MGTGMARLLGIIQGGLIAVAGAKIYELSNLAIAIAVVFGLMVVCFKYMIHTTERFELWIKSKLYE